MRTFILLTLRRSVLHQGIVVVLSAVGAGIVVNSLLSSDVLPAIRQGGLPPPQVTASIIWTPYALMFVTARAVRMALLVPIEPRANWVYRMTESVASRARHLDAAVHVLLVASVAVPVALMLPLQWLVFGPLSLAVASASAVMGWLYVELLMQSWARIPFTCSYIPGKGFVPQALLLRIFSFAAFTGLGSALGAMAARLGVAAIVFGALVLAAAAGLRYWRRTHLYDLPLEFEDAVPSEINPLRLS